MRVKKDKNISTLVVKPEKKNYVTAKMLLNAHGKKIDDLNNDINGISKSLSINTTETSIAIKNNEIIKHDIKELTKIVAGHGLNIDYIKKEIKQISSAGITFGNDYMSERLNNMRNLVTLFAIFAASSTVATGLLLYHVWR